MQNIVPKTYMQQTAKVLQNKFMQTITGENTTCMNTSKLLKRREKQIIAQELHQLCAAHRGLVTIDKETYLN